MSKVIQHFHQNKLHHHDNIIYSREKYTICQPLEKMLKQPLLTSKFPSEYKKGNIVPIQKTCDKQDLKN